MAQGGPVVRGTVKFYRADKGWGGLVSPDLPHDIWVHFSAIEMEGFRELADEWLVEMFAPDRIEAAAADVVAADADAIDPRVASARTQVAEARRKIDRHLAALEAGLDPSLVPSALVRPKPSWPPRKRC